MERRGRWSILYLIELYLIFFCVILAYVLYMFLRVPGVCIFFVILFVYYRKCYISHGFIKGRYYITASSRGICERIDVERGRWFIRDEILVWLKFTIFEVFVREYISCCPIIWVQVIFAVLFEVVKVVWISFYPQSYRYLLEQFDLWAYLDKD